LAAALNKNALKGLATLRERKWKMREGLTRFIPSIPLRVLFSFWKVVGILVIFQGCASVPQRPVGETPLQQGVGTGEIVGPLETMGPPEAYGPPAIDAPPSYGPDPVKLRPVVLVLGPGMARGFAYIGVIRVLESEKIPIGAILGTEMGSLVGTLYAMSPNVNQFEWNLQKFKGSVFLEKKGFFTGNRSRSILSEGTQLENQLQSILGDKDLKESKVPLIVALQSQRTGLPFLLNSGKAATIVRAAMASPTLFTAKAVENRGEDSFAVSANSTRPFLVKEARELGIGPVLVVNVLNSSETAAAQKELQEADLVIRPELRDIGKMDFEKRTDIAYRGRKAILQHLSEIRKWVGLPAAGHRKGSVQP
jgi:NTE family protein